MAEEDPQINNTPTGTFEEVLSLLSLAKEHRLKQDVQCIEYADKAVFIAHANQMPFQAAEAKLEIARYYISAIQDYDAALHHAVEAYSFLENESHPFLSANIYKVIGICHHQLGNFTNAVSNYLQAAKLLESETLLTTEELLLAGSIHYNIILIYQHLSFDKEKFIHLEKALSLYTKAGNQEGIAKCYCIYAEYDDTIKNDYQKQLELYEKALAIFKDTKNKMGQLACICPMGLLFCKSGDIEKGIRWLQDGLHQCIETENISFIASAHNYFARAHRHLKDFEEAINHYITVEELLRKNKRTVELYGLYKEMASALAESGDFKSAYDYHIKYSTAKDEWLNFDKATALHNAIMRFALEKQESDTALQQSKNIEIESYSRQLKISNDELKQIAYVAAHDLREPLRMINSYTKLIENKFKGKGNQAITEYTSIIRKSSNRMYEMIQDIMAFSRADSKPTMQLIDISTTLKDVKFVLDIILTKHNVDLKWDTNMPKIYSDKTMLFQIFQNLILNAVKYNTSEIPIIRITHHTAHSAHIFEVHDNGIGIPEEERENVFFLFSRLHQKGNNSSGDGIGLAVCKKAVEKLNGKIWIETSYLKGTCVKFSLPK